METATFNILRYILLVFFVWAGYRQSRDVSGSGYWKTAFLPIVLYSFMEGLRWGRGKDFFGYYSLVTTSYYYTKDILFDYIGKLFYTLDLPSYFFFIFQSFFLITCVYYFLRGFRECIIPCIILMFAYSMQQSENLVRQYCAMSIVLIVIVLLREHKNIWALVWIGISMFVHKSVAFAYVFLVIFYLICYKDLGRKKIRWICILFVSSYFIAPVLKGLFNQLFVVISPYVALFSDKYGSSSYLSFATKSGVYMDMDFGMVYQVREFLRNLVIIIGGACVINNIYIGDERKKSFFVCYGMGCMGILYDAILPDFGSEVLWRLGFYLLWIAYFVEGVIIYHTVFRKKEILQLIPNVNYASIWYLAVWSLVILELVWILKPRGLGELGLMFIWDR